MSNAETALRHRLSYCPESGVLRWTAGRNHGRVAGYIATKGYRQVRVAGRAYAAHRVAWLLHYGCWPSQQIDHINGIPDDNRIANLRDVDGHVNAQNRRRAMRHSKTGVLGVSPFRDRYRADIRVEGKLIPLGHFLSIEDAREAYVQAKRKFHPGARL